VLPTYRNSYGYGTSLMTILTGFCASSTTFDSRLVFLRLYLLPSHKVSPETQAPSQTQADQNLTQDLLNPVHDFLWNRDLNWRTRAVNNSGQEYCFPSSLIPKPSIQSSSRKGRPSPIET